MGPGPETHPRGFFPPLRAPTAAGGEPGTPQPGLALPSPPAAGSLTASNGQAREEPPGVGWENHRPPPAAAATTTTHRAPAETRPRTWRAAERGRALQEAETHSPAAAAAAAAPLASPPPPLVIRPAAAGPAHPHPRGGRITGGEILLHTSLAEPGRFSQGITGCACAPAFFPSCPPVPAARDAVAGAQVLPLHLSQSRRSRRGPCPIRAGTATSTSRRGARVGGDRRVG